MWQVEFPKGWYDIDVSVQESIQLAYESGSPTVVVSVLQSSRLDLWRHYEIDFSRMEQRNVDSGRIRKIRLSPGDANAPLALEDGKRKRSSEEKGNKMAKTGSKGCAAGSHCAMGLLQSKPATEEQT